MCEKSSLRLGSVSRQKRQGCGWRASVCRSWAWRSSIKFLRTSHTRYTMHNLPISPFASENAVQRRPLKILPTSGEPGAWTLFAHDMVPGIRRAQIGRRAGIGFRSNAAGGDARSGGSTPLSAFRRAGKRTPSSGYPWWSLIFRWS